MISLAKNSRSHRQPKRILHLLERKKVSLTTVQLLKKKQFELDQGVSETPWDPVAIFK